MRRATLVERATGLLLVLQACGSPPGTTSEVIGPRGGTLCLEHKEVCLEVPPGALERDVQLTIRGSTAIAPAPIGQVWDIGPDGTSFVTPATVSMNYALLPGVDDGGIPASLVRIFTVDDAGWMPLSTPGFNRVAQTISGTTTHLSPFVAMRADALPDGGFPPRPDAGVPDAGRPDAGVPDAGRPDAGVPDAGRPDAGVPDAGVPDAGVPDAGVPDAGVPDAGVPDAGEFDAGEADAGSGGVDAGDPDAGAGDAG